MKKIFILFGIIFFGIPDVCFAWGPMTHTYFAHEVLRAASLLSASVYTLLTAYSTNFIYGSIAADNFLGKPGHKNPHDWETGFLLLSHARKNTDAAFAYGFLTHLAADTVAHGQMDLGAKSKLGHAWIEMESDSLMAKSCWKAVVGLDKDRLKSNDRLARLVIDPQACRSRGFQQIYRMSIHMSVLNSRRWTNFYKEDFAGYHRMSVIRAIDVINKKEDSKFVHHDPNIKKGRKFSARLQNILA
ncbi:zinc dependent phospholipase C family protein [Desulfonatronovibrio hydrogenovorans]|uniref:zinc dependent phospholipase C family protein n=1 Tax=Desulfonatronovibrio hydrogenovorans TaxID=53245 RepID=UPI0006892412|nr:zinc dependent phospholipase C family protein [Desulfonatronovibrio hydrogenovorans]